ncbi:MAG: GrpB family protein [Acholeplasmataceae bacterium]|nr:GrpB family protein [Acholeplasmataceae bacterium]
MEKRLQDMTLEELWELFPIILVPHNDLWESWFQEKEAEIRSYVSPQHLKRISHIGSTALTLIKAKNIVDILLEVPGEEDFNLVLGILETKGWILMHQESGRASLNQGYTEEGFSEKVFHLHLRLAGDNDEIYFRDYLREHPEVAKEYEILKLNLEKKYRNNRDAYTEAKTDFISKYTRIAQSDLENKKAE